MKETKEYKISIVLFCVALILFGISLVTGLIPGLVFAVDKICMYLGFAALCFGLGLLKKAKDNNDAYYEANRPGLQSKTAAFHF